MFPVLPDLDLALITFLAGHTGLTPLHGGRVGVTLSGAATQIRVASLGGPDTHPWEADTEFQVDSWGGTLKQASDLDRAVCSAIYDMRGPIPGSPSPGWVTVAVPTLRHLWQPDENGRPRFISQVRIQATP